MPERWRTRLRHLFWRPDAFRAELKRLATAPAEAIDGLPYDLVVGLEPEDPAGTEELVALYLEKEGMEAIGVRTVAEIAEILLAAVADARAEPLAPDVAELIERYLAITGSGRRHAGARSGVDASAAHRHFRGSGCVRAAHGAAVGQAASISRKRTSPPSSAATSSTTPASCSR